MAHVNKKGMDPKDNLTDGRILFEAGRLLGLLGDIRFKNFELMDVPEGPFLCGSSENEGKPRELPAQAIWLDTFRIGKTQITNSEFKEFIDENGYKRKEFWSREGWYFIKEEEISEPLYWRDRKWNGPNFPIIGISWYEAEAFTIWLSLKTGYNYRLPTEAEWEKAARGTDGRTWPWGNKFDVNLCNSYELGLGGTSPVGIFSSGRSPYGCYDMAGNVWEWCQDWFDMEYYQHSPEKNPLGPADGGSRVVRGGGWFVVSDRCRCAYRNNILPNLRDNLVGFRIAQSLE